MATIVIYPQAGSGGSNVTSDGYIRYNPANVSWASLVTASTGTAVDLTEGSPTTSVGAGTDGSTNNFNLNCRYFWTFDTSPLTSSAQISSATLSLFGISKSSGLGSTNFHVVQSTQANANTLTTADYSAVGNTSFGSVDLASFSTSSYNVITLNASGIANINKTGASKFAMMSEWDLNQNFTGVWSGNTFTGFESFMADIGTTSEEPALTITYTTDLNISVSDSPSTSESLTIMEDERPSVSDSSTVVDKVSYFSDLVLISDVPTATPTFPPGLNIDLNITANALGVNSVSTHPFSTAYANEVLIALVNINTISGNDPIVSGGGLTWVQITKRDTQNAPNSYIYRAFTASPLSNVVIKATAPDASSYDIQITVLSFLGADQTGTNGSGAIGATAVGGNTGTTKPTLSLNTTRAGSFVVGIYGYNNNETLVADTGQTIYGQQQDVPLTIAMASLGQNVATPASGTSVTIDLTTLTGWDWNGAIVEVLSALQLANINVSDSPITSESVTVIPTIGNISVNDATTTSESVTLDLINLILVNDATTTTENVKMNEENDPVVHDSPSTTENIQISMSADIISNFDATTASEAITITMSAYIINVNDATTTSENVKMEMDNFASVNNATTTSENVKMTQVNNVNASDATTTSENIAVAITGQNVVSDSVTTSENVKMGIDNFVSVNDASTTSEFVNPQITVDFISVVDALLATDIRRNSVTNPSFEADTVGSNPPATYTAFTTINTGSLTPQVANDSSFSGGQSWKITVTGGHADAGLISPRYSVNPGQYTISHYMRTTLSVGSAHMHVKVYSGVVVTAEYDLAGASGTTGWTRYSTTIQLQPTDTAIELWIGFGTFGDSLATGTVWYDALQIEAGSLSAYFDGSFPAVNWDGSPNASTSSTASTVETVDIVDVDVVSDSVTTSENVSIMLTIFEAMPSVSSGEHQGLIVWS